MRSHTNDHVISRLDILLPTSSEQKRTKKPANTFLQVKTNLTTSAKSTKTYSFIEKYLAKTTHKTAWTLIKLAQKNATRNSKKFPATQRKKQPNCAGKPPNWQHCSSGDDRIVDFYYPILSCFWKTISDPNPGLVKIILTISENYPKVYYDGQHSLHFCIVSILPHEAK